MGDAQDNFGNASELIRQGLMRAGAPRDTPQMPHGNPGGGEYFGHDRSTAEQMIREGLRASAVASTQPLSNDDERAAQIGQRLIDASNERIDQQRPREASTEPARSAEDFIRDGLRAGRAREEAAAQAKEAAKPKVRRTW